MEKFLPAGRFDDFRNSGDSIILLSGPPSSGKTSLVFQFAINSATASAGNVVFICNRRKLESKPPYLAQGIDPSSEVINRIQMKYVDNEEGIKKYFAAFHMHDPAPVSVIIDDFADFFDQGFMRLSKVKWTKAYRRLHGKDMTQVSTFEFERKRNRPEGYDRNVTENTLKAIKKIDKIRVDREERHITKRMKGKKAKEQREAMKELEQSIHMVEAHSVLDKEPSLTLPTKVKVSQKQSQEWTFYFPIFYISSN